MKKPSKPQSIHSKYFKFLAPAALLILAVAFWWLYQPKSSKPEAPAQTVQQKANISQNEALDIVTKQEKVQGFLKEVPGGKITMDHFDEETNSYVIQVFEVKNGHTNTFNWYDVNKQSGEVKPLLP